MSLNVSAMAKTAVVIGAVWAILFAVDQMGPVSQIGQGATIELPDYGLTISDNQGKMPKGAPPGVLVTAVAPGGFAAQHKLLQGDVITAINRVGYSNVRDVEKRFKRGDARSLMVWRDGEEVNPERLVKKAKASSDPRDYYNGIEISTAGDEEGRAPNAPPGLWINGVDRNSIADKAGVKVGNIITAVNGKKVVNGDTYFFALYPKWDAKVAPPLSLTLWQDGTLAEVKIR